MRLSPTHRLTTSPAAALLVLLAIGYGAPSTARAGCAHYVRWQPGHASAGLDLLGSLAVTTPAAGESPSAPPRPCSGLSCAGDPAPTVPPGLVPGDAPGSWAILEPPPPIDPPGMGRRPRRHDAVLPLHVGPSVFHPPRPSSL